jgi:hypothetical protein
VVVRLAALIKFEIRITNGSLDEANGGTNSADQMNYAARVRKGMSSWRDKRAAKNVWESGTR